MGKNREKTRERMDLVEKEFEAYPDTAADIINVLLYDGDRYVTEADLLSASTESLYEGADRIRNQYQDRAMYQMQNGEAELLYQFANQTRPDSGMLLRKAGYTGGAYREQYDGKTPYRCPVIELVLYWGEKPWRGARSMRRMFRRKRLPPKAWQYIDDLKLHVWEMRRLPPEVRELFTSDMRIVADYLAEGDSYRSDRPVRHKEALIKMIRVLSGEEYVEDTADILKAQGIREEDEIKVCELFDQYERKGKQEGIQQGIQEGIQQGIGCTIVACKKLKATFKDTAEQIKELYHLSEADTQRNMELYW